LVAEYLASLAENSERPRSVLNNAMSALGHVYRAFGLPNVTENYEIRMLTIALVKSGTVVPMVRSKKMPLSNFHALFMSWSDNGSLDLKSLRLKAVTLLGLTAMLRPFDFAPNARYIDDQGVECRIVFSVDQVLFSDQDATITFLLLLGLHTKLKRRRQSLK